MDELITQHPVNRRRDERPLLRRYKEIRRLRKLVEKGRMDDGVNGWNDGWIDKQIDVCLKLSW